METKYTKLKQVLRTILNSAHSADHDRLRINPSKFDSFFDTYTAKFKKTLDNNGKEYTLELFKELHNQAVCLTTGETWSKIRYHKSSKEGISTLLLPISKHLRGNNVADIRIIMSVTRIYETIRLKPELNLDPLVTPYNGTVDLGEFTDGFEEFLLKSTTVSKLKSRLPQLFGSQQLIGRMRSGPNGRAIVTSHYDAVAIMANTVLAQAISTFNALLSQTHITGNMIWCAKQCESLELPKSMCTGKIALASTKAGKTRLFAIGDYWSQNSLQTLHDWLMKILKSLPTDATYNQDEGFERIQRKKVSYMASFDISKFTDRVPLSLQTKMLGYYTHPNLAQEWEKIVSAREFRAPNKEMIRWSVGQPLGLLSSWATCTLLHHHLVWYASYRHFQDYRTFTGYQMLGDDIVIWHKGVAKAYANLLEELGIEINQTKSKLYNNKNKEPYFEFAKRVSVNGQEVTGIPFELLVQSTQSIYNYVDLVIYLVKTKLLQDSRNLALPEYLSNKGKYFLEILLFEKSLGRPTWLENRLGNAFEETALLNELRKQVAKVRIQGFQELIRKLDELCYSSDLEQELRKAGVVHSDALIGYGGDYYHPIVHSLNAVGMQMYETLPILEDIEAAEASGRELLLPELTSIEYLPLPYMSAHFERPGKRNPERLKRHSQLVISATKQLEDHPFGFVLLNEEKSSESQKLKIVRSDK